MEAFNSSALGIGEGHLFPPCFHVGLDPRSAAKLPRDLHPAQGGSAGPGRGPMVIHRGNDMKLYEPGMIDVLLVCVK